MDLFKDRFSKQAAHYAKYRPDYPGALFDYLQSLTPGHERAWDCGTGSGQSALQLARLYDKVYATDPSAEQIRHASPHPKILYRVEKAEEPDLSDSSVDLITVAQAVHWFDLDLFYKAVNRVLKPGGIIALWAYGLPDIDPGINALIREFHDHTVGGFWLPENRLIEQEYATIPFPFQEIPSPAFLIKKSLQFDDLPGLLRSWSATQSYIDAYHRDPVPAVEEQLSVLWPERGQALEASWKLSLRVGQKR